MTLALATSLDGKWAAARQDRRLVLLERCAGAPVAELELDSEDVDLVFVGPPAVLVVISRVSDASTIALYQPPSLAAAPRLELEIPARLAAATGHVFVLLSLDGKHALVVRTSGRALASQVPELEGPIELVVGLERNQLLFSLPRKLEVLDAISCRPLARSHLPLPAPPRVVGAALGHVWAIRRGGDHVAVYRLSDGRPFEHDAGSPILDVICHPASPVLVLVTAQGLLRLHCHAHSLTAIAGVPEPRGALALVVEPALRSETSPAHLGGEEIHVAGFTGIGVEPWRVRVTRP